MFAPWIALGVGVQPSSSSSFTSCDTHGHAVGDRALATVGRVLKEALRASDIACRYGGDEFLVVLPETSLAGAVRAMENVRQHISPVAVQTADGQMNVTASVGVTIVELTEEDPNVPIMRADAALYDAKRSGRWPFRRSRARWSDPTSATAAGRSACRARAPTSGWQSARW